jgi:uroporphyrin-III C-methyltransferase / precorrin-2 dehydrogenase / sirohydrochlorin ferrochelatase
MLIGDGAAADAKRRLIERAGARIIGEAEAGARFAFVAGIDPPEPVHARLKARDLLVNVADRPELCDFTIPAIVDRDPVIVAVGTGGASAGLAAVLRQRLEALLPASLGRVAVALKHARLKAGKDGWRERLGVLLAPGGPLDPMVDHPEPAVALDGSPAQAGRRECVTITSSDPDELTLRAARLLAQAERIYHAPDMPAAILDRARADAQRIVGSPPALLPPGLSLELIWTA